MITVLRLGHRRGRDDRISSHVGLTARQFGADKVIYSGEKDDNMLESLEDVRDRWGGPFEITYREDYRRVIKGFDGTSVHLTMYGLPFQEKMDTVREAEDLLVVVGSQKVPRDVYGLVDHNLAVGHQPHSEVAAVGVFLYEYNGRAISDEFEDAKIRVEPTADQKKT
ncbi:MAG: tRNA (cytidine(56)-2'-O)-methyltransferase, partial [Candidatus Nanohaloarchaea archaeon]|nr:tRNA (cytidine(56)-2'-O)-methyltransferase [Candidatus Nanohaloarchaea archaeon]